MNWSMQSVTECLQALQSVQMQLHPVDYSCRYLQHKTTFETSSNLELSLPTVLPTDDIHARMELDSLPCLDVLKTLNCHGFDEHIGVLRGSILCVQKGEGRCIN